MEILDFGVSEYENTLRLQQDLFENLIKGKLNGVPDKEFILLGEHKPVITIGRRGNDENLLVPETDLNSKGIKIFHIGRGGDITYHAPGQLILYPIIDLERHHLGVKDFVNLMEESVIQLLKSYRIKGERVEGATGVWIGKGTPNERKICAMGIKCSRFCTMHGLALNINVDLSGFSMINPCGFQDKGVTSMQKEFGKPLIFNDIKQELLKILVSFLSPANNRQLM